MAKLSPKMQEAADKARENGGVLIRSVHGYWTWPECPVHAKPDWTGNHVPTWFTRLATVEALVEAGVLEVTNRVNGEAHAVRLIADPVPA